MPNSTKYMTTHAMEGAQLHGSSTDNLTMLGAGLSVANSTICVCSWRSEIMARLRRRVRRLDWERLDRRDE
mgnify:CR=1 FL=1